MQLNEISKNSLSNHANNDEKIAPSSKHTKELFKDFYSGVTLHGFCFLFQGHWSRRLVWIVITSGVFLFSIYLFYGLLNKYLERQTTTESTLSFEPKLSFPTITFCPFNALSQKKLEKLPFNYSQDYFSEEFRGDFPKNNSEKIKFLDNLEAFGVNSLIDFHSLYQLRYEDVSNKDIIHNYGECTFYNQPCNQSMFSEKIWGLRWLCFQFNALQEGIEQLYAKNEHGYFNGLQLFFDIENISPVFHLSGVLVAVTKYGDSDDVRPKNMYISIRPGQFSVIKLTERRVSSWLKKTNFNTIHFALVGPSSC